MLFRVNWMAQSRQGPLAPAWRKALESTSAQQSGLMLSGFNLADLGHFLGLFLQEKEQLSGNAERLLLCVGGLCLGNVTLHFGSSPGGYLLSIYVFNNMFTASL